MAALTDRAVLIAGATSASGRAAARTLLDAGAHVVATGRDAAKLVPLAELKALFPPDHPLVKRGNRLSVMPVPPEVAEALIARRGSR